MKARESSAAGTPPVASATRQPAPAAGSSLLAAPEGESSRVVAAPELVPVPYTQRLQLPAAPASAASEGGGEGGEASAAVGASGAAATAGEPEAGDGMENLSQQVRAFPFGGRV